MSKEEEEEKEKNKEENIIQENKINKPKSTLSLLSVHDFKERNKKTKFTPKSNNRWIFIKENKDKQNQELENNLKIRKIDSNIDEEKLGKTLKKWKNLQKSIKEELSLEELIIEKQRQDNSQLKEKFRDYYKVKLKSRKEYEKIKDIDSNTKNRDIEYILDNNIERVLLDTCEPIKNLMFLFRNNYDYTVKLISLISESDDEEKKNSLVELLCNQFYDNILIQSKNQNNLEISLLIYKLLEDEIISMNSVCVDDFLSENTFIGKFLTLYVRKDEFRLFFGKLLNPLLLSIENSDDDCLDISLANIKSKLAKKEKDKSPITSPRVSAINKEDNDDNFDINILYKDIKYSSVLFTIKNDLDDNKSQIKFNNEDNLNINISNNNINIDLKKDDNKKENIFSSSFNELPTITKKKSLVYIKEGFNNEYSEDLNQEKIIDKILKEKNKDMKDFYIHQLEQISSDPDIFTNSGLKNVINEYYIKDNKTMLIKKYKENFIFIKNMIDTLIQDLINKINIIPYSLKCICKLISILISKKFPHVPKFYQNSFIGKFFFDKCIFPILSLDSKNAIINSIFSSCTKKCINVIVNVLSNANRASLYMTNYDTEKTIFNYYLIEIIPILNKFYEMLIDIKLPKIFEQYINMIDNKIKDNIDNRIFHFKRRKNPNIWHDKKEKKQNDENKEKQNNEIKDKNIINIENKIEEYDYFKDNPDEIMRLQGICFNLSDVMFILSLISRNEKIFKNLPKYDFFNKTVERIKCDDYKLEEEIKKNSNSNKLIFYMIYKDEKNTQLEKLFKSKKQSKVTFYDDEKMDKDPANICKRIKFCIKYILKNIDLNFSYLNKATTTDKFFTAISYELNDFGENTEILDKVPIKWYSQYIYENKNNLDINYRKNDYQLLYDELSEEENEKLIELRNITSKLITKNNINLNSAEELITKINFSLEDILEEKKCAKIEKFIDTEEIKICMLTSRDGKDTQKIMIREVSECTINNEFHNQIEKTKTKNKISCHTHYIKDFINKFSYTHWEKDNKFSIPKKLVSQDIQRGKRTNQIFKTFKDYLEIIKKRLKAPVNNKNLFNDITDYNEIVEKVEDHILRQIYKYVYPKTKSDLDKNFYKKALSLGWITPNMLDIKKISVKQLDHTQKCIEQLEEGNSVNDKLNSIREAHASLNNAIKFSNGDESNAGQDEITPIFQYIIIKAHPERIYSNMNYIRTFLDESELSGSKGFLLSQIESAISYIENINHESLKMTSEEYDERMKKWQKEQKNDNNKLNNN